MKRCGKCNNGKIFDISLGKFTDCYDCSLLLDNLAENGVEDDNGTRVSLAETLGFTRKFSRLNFDMYAILGEYMYRHIDKSVLEPFESSLGNLTSSILEGNIPKSSLLIYLGSSADTELLGYLILANAYKVGLKVGEYLTPFRLRSIRRSVDDYGSLLKQDIVVASYSPTIREDAVLMEDLLRERAVLSKPTIFILSDGYGLNSTIQRICAYEGFSYSKALYMGIPYLSKNETEQTKINRVNRVIANSNKNLKTNTPELVLEQDEKPSSPTRKQKKGIDLTERSYRSVDLFGH